MYCMLCNVGMWWMEFSYFYFAISSNHSTQFILSCLLMHRSISNSLLIHSQTHIAVYINEGLIFCLAHLLTHKTWEPGSCMLQRWDSCYSYSLCIGTDMNNAVQPSGEHKVALVTHADIELAAEFL